MSRNFLVLTGIILFSNILFGNDPTSGKVPAKDEYYVAAFIWPSCHHDPKAREIWSEGTGEWEVVKKGNPRFEGHYQPKVPLWGYEMDNDPKVVEKWINAATDHGVNVFIYDWYWYNEGPFLEGALNDGFLKAENNEKMYFYLMWANHDMPMHILNHHQYPSDAPVVWSASVDWKNWTVIVERTIKQYFLKPNYFKIDGQPVFGVFDLRTLQRTCGGVEEARKALDYFRDEARKAGFPGVHFQWNASNGGSPSEAERVQAIGFDSIAPYNMGGLPTEDYVVYGINSITIREEWNKVLNIPFFPCVSVGWDDTPRYPQSGKGRVVHYNRSPESFAALLSKAKQYTDQRPGQPKLIVINAWNEWIEDSYLLPDMKYGFGFLEAVKDVMSGKYERYTENR